MRRPSFEAYAVLTRLPAPWRLRAEVAERLLRETLKEHPAVASLPDENTAWSVVRDLARRGLTGGTAERRAEPVLVVLRGSCRGQTP